MSHLSLQHSLFVAALTLYGLAVLLLVLIRRSEQLRYSAGRPVLFVAFLLHTAMIGLRWYAAGRPPFANMYEALVLFSWAVVFVYVVFERMYQARFMAVPVLVMALVFGILALMGENAMKPLMPALQSPWMAVHVLTYFIGYGALSVAFFLGCIYLAAGNRGSPVAVKDLLDEASYRLVAFGFPFLTMGMITGSVWANVAWGNYWFWDPKETCSLITWLVYLVFLHLRLLRGWRGRRSAFLLVLGFLATLFTFVGVNYVLPGLHSYSGT